MPYFWPRNTMRKSPSTHLAVCGCKQHADFGNLRFVRFQAELIAYALPLLIEEALRLVAADLREVA